MKKYKLSINSITEAVIELFTLQDMLRWAISQFNIAQLFYGHGTDNPWDEALLLILSVLFLPLDFPLNLYSVRLTSNEKLTIIKLIARRINERIPVYYLINKAWFCDLEFYIDKRVMIPRTPIGELIVKRFQNLLPRSPEHILDMCTGSGCIAIACAYSYPLAEIDAVDICKNALLVTEINIQKHGLEQRVFPICSDLFCNLPLLKYDLIITNPPYIDIKSIKNLPEEFHFEPILSLSGGIDGLSLIQRILMSAVDYLSDDGILICEVGNSMASLIKKYPQFSFNWLKLFNGGNGVFMVTRQMLKTI